MSLEKSASKTADYRPLSALRPPVEPEATVDYRDDEESPGSPPGHRRIALVPDAQPEAAFDVQSLLHRRLRIVSLVFLLPFYGFLVRNSLEGSAAGSSAPLFWFHGSVALALTALSLILWTRRTIPLRQLRLIELSLFGCVAAFFAWLHYEWFQNEGVIQRALQRQGDSGRDLALEALTGSSSAFRWSILIVMYGVLIPNTWQRCAAVVGVAACTPPLMTLVLSLTDGALGSSVFKAVLDQCLMLFLAASVAAFGSYRIATLQREVSEARRLGQYRLKERLGTGGMGEVYLAEHILLRRPCAIKLIRPERAVNASVLQRFEREVQAMTRLTHWNVVEVFDYGRASDGTFYYVMEYLPGLTLEELVTRHGPVPPGRAVHLLRQVCAALAEAHSKGLIHRDLKPGNIIIGERGGAYDVAKLLDFGLVQGPDLGATSDKLTQCGVAVGTPGYMSPEQARGDGELQPASDLYSLGALGYYLLTGQPPFVRPSVVQTVTAHITDPPVPPSQLRPEVPSDLQMVILTCLEKEPHRRFRDASTVEQALADCTDARAWTQTDARAWWEAQSAE